jgi:predicted transcriptional regulator
MAQENESGNMKRPYANARDVLPPEVLDTVRRHFTGLLWVPSDVGFYEERRKLVLALKGQEVTTREIARLSGVTPRRVRQIVAQGRAEPTPTHRDPLR